MFFYKSIVLKRVEIHWTKADYSPSKVVKRLHSLLKASFKKLTFFFEKLISNWFPIEV